MQTLSFVLVTIVALAQSGVMLAVELNRTHARHPQWPGHARFHLVWQNFTSASFSLMTVALLWCRGVSATHRLYLAAALTAVPFFAFLFAFAARGLYQGTLSDPEGVPPLRISFRGRVSQLDGNLTAVLLGLVVLLVAVVLFHFGRS